MAKQEDKTTDQSGHSIPNEWRTRILARKSEGEEDPNLVVTTPFSIPSTEIVFRLVLAEDGNASGLPKGVYAWTNIHESELPKNLAEGVELNQMLGHCVWQQLETFEKGLATRTIMVTASKATQSGQIIFSVNAARE